MPEQREKCPKGCGSDIWHVDVDCPQNNWKEEFRHNWDKVWEIAHYNITTREGMIDFISSLLSSQAHALKEQMKEHGLEQYALGQQEGIEYGKKDMKEKAIACVPEIKTPRFETDLASNCFNDCREQTLSAIESIEI